jgi:hypothetical protein
MDQGDNARFDRLSHSEDCVDLTIRARNSESHLSRIPASLEAIVMGRKAPLTMDQFLIGETTLP